MEIKPGKYRHFKGNLYEVIGVASHSETLEPMVVYRALYGEGGLWVRPAAMWSETGLLRPTVFSRGRRNGRTVKDASVFFYLLPRSSMI